MIRFFLVLATLLLLGAGDPPPALDRLHRADGALLVPDHFLRAWDPITVFFDHDAGPAAGGPEDAPERLLTLAPPQPGAWTWLDARTLQFRPAEPWTPLRRETVSVAGRSATLVPLLPVPVADALPEGANADRFSLTFAAPVDLAALTRLIGVELRPAPGISAEGAQTLAASDYTVRAADRGDGKEQQTYLVVLRQPIPDDRIAVLRLRLSDEPGLDDPVFELRSAAPTAFAVTDFLCADGYRHDVDNGMVSCAAEGTDSERPRGIMLQFSAEPEPMDIVRARQLLRFSPPVDDLAVRPNGSEVQLTGRFRADTVYELRLDGLKDRAGRALAGETAARRFSFVPSAPALRWDADQGIVERFGPQMLPLRGHGYARADIRIHPIDPLSRDFWPFPADVTTRDAAPPLPGNEPRPWDQPGSIGPGDLKARIAALGSPAISELVDLPIQRGGVDAKFGIDAAPLLSRIAGAGEPGAYLVGLRPVDGADRTWLRIQVTDLSLTAVEEADRVRFAVTSLATARPVADAEVRLEGQRGQAFETLVRGVTDAEGFWSWAPYRGLGGNLTRVVVTKGADQLVLEPGRGGPPRYAEGTWAAHPQDDDNENWLDWTVQGFAERGEPARLLCHLFTERPIYRPEEPVLIGGIIRRWRHGSLDYDDGPGTVVITGPDDQEYKIPVTVDDVGGLHARFDDKTEATGDYTMTFVPDGKSPWRAVAGDNGCGEITFKKEAYRLPTFEVLLNGPAARDARRAVPGRAGRALVRRRATVRSPDPVARDAVPVCLDPARPRRLRVLQRLSVFQRHAVPLDAGARPHRDHRCRRLRVAHARPDHRADRAAARIRRRSNRHRQRRHPGAQHAARDCAAAVRARPAPAALPRSSRRDRARRDRDRRRGQAARGPADHRAADPPQLEFCFCGPATSPRARRSTRRRPSTRR